MDETKKSAPDSGGGQLPGRVGKEGERGSQGAVQAMVPILTSAHPLRHIRTDWASRNALAVALGVHVDTIHRRATAAGVRTRLEVTDQHRCRVMYLVADVRDRMLNDKTDSAGGAQ